MGLVFSFGVFYSGWNIGEWFYEFKKTSDQLEHSFYNAVALGKFGPEIFENFSKQKELTLIFIGDVMFERGVKAKILKNNDFKFPFLKVAEFLNSADITFGNLEGPVSKRGKSQGSVYSFRFDPRVMEGIKFAGFDVMSVANNHIMDYGRDALLDTIQILRDSGVVSVGAGENYEAANKEAIFDVKAQKVAYLAYTNLYPKGLMATAKGAGVSDFDLLKIKDKISDLKNKADLIIISLHWGVEYKKEANEEQKKIGRELIEAGADLIIGHHPHVPEEIEQYKDGWIIYSLGNFVFDQNFSEETMGGLVVQIKVKNGEIKEVEPIPIKINSDFQPEF